MFVSTHEVIGNPVLVFYGTALYVALSPLVWLFGPDAGMRLAVVVALAVPPFAMARFFLALGIDRLTTACLTICLAQAGVSTHEHLYARRGYGIFCLSAHRAGHGRVVVGLRR